MSIKKGKDTRAHRSPRLLSELEQRLDSTRLSTPDRALPVLLLLNQNHYKWRTTSIVWCVLNSTMRILIKWLREAFTDIIELV
jgi:hypothetical protein